MYTHACMYIYGLPTNSMYVAVDAYVRMYTHMHICNGCKIALVCTHQSAIHTYVTHHVYVCACMNTPCMCVCHINCASWTMLMIPSLLAYVCMCVCA